MKRIFSFLLLFAGTAMVVAAQKIKVPDAVKKAFDAKFPGATDLKWEKESKDELEATFNWNGASLSANFGLDGAWKETETTIPGSMLPAAVTDSVRHRYPGAVIDRAEKIEKPGGKVAYEVNITVKGKKKELELNTDGTPAQ